MATDSWSNWFARHFGTEAQRAAAEAAQPSTSSEEGLVDWLLRNYGSEAQRAARTVPAAAPTSGRVPKYRTGTELGPYDQTRMQSASTSPVIPVPTPRPKVSTPQSDVFLNNDPNDMRPGSLGEAMKLFPNRPLQQAIYYTDPRTHNMQRLGVGADTANLNPDYISRIWEPSNMSGGEKFFRGAYEKQGPNPITYDPTAQAKSTTAPKAKIAPTPMPAPTTSEMPEGSTGPNPRETLNAYASRAGMTPPYAHGGHIEQAERHAHHKARPVHAGFINMAVGGRTDHLPMEVAEGSYVIPAQEVGFLGQGNSLAGAKILDKMFPHSGQASSIHKAVGGDVDLPSTNRFTYMADSFTPPGDIRAGIGGQNLGGLKNLQNLGETGPMGTKIPNARANPNIPKVEIQPPYTPNVNDIIKNFGKAPKNEARGGQIHAGNRSSIPIMAAGGEYVVSPEDVATYGGGDIDKGHEKLDHFVMYVRKHGLKTVRNLPGPKKN